MARVIVIIGLPGSGKSFLSRQILKENPGFEILDDPTQKESHILINLLENGKNLIVCDPHLCNPANRKLAESIFADWGYEVSRIFFENNVEKCKNNIKFRNDERIIDRFETFQYVVPEWAEPLKIWQNEEKL